MRREASQVRLSGSRPNRDRLAGDHRVHLDEVRQGVAETVTADRRAAAHQAGGAVAGRVRQGACQPAHRGVAVPAEAACLRVSSGAAVPLAFPSGAKCREPQDGRRWAHLTRRQPVAALLAQRVAQAEPRVPRGEPALLASERSVPVKRDGLRPELLVEPAERVAGSEQSEDRLAPPTEFQHLSVQQGERQEVRQQEAHPEPEVGQE